MKLKFVTKNGESMPTFYANSVSGNITTRGDLAAHFAIEYAPTRLIEEITVGEEISPKQNTRSLPEEVTVTRDYQLRLMLPLSQLESIAQWFSERLEDARRLQSVEETNQ